MSPNTAALLQQKENYQMPVINTTLAERRRNIVASMSALLAKKRSTSGGLSPEESDIFSKWCAELDHIQQENGTVLNERHVRAYEKWLRFGDRKLNYDERLAFSEIEYRATVGLEGGGAAYPGSVNGVIVPMAYADAIVSATKYAGPLMQLCNVDVTPHGNPKAYPGDNDTSASAAFVTEGGAASAVDVNVNQVILNGYKVQSNVVVMSIEAVEDVKVTPDLHGYLSQRFGVRFGRLINQYTTIGSGSSQPTGFITAAGAATGTAAGANANDGTSNAHNSLGTADFQTLQAALDYSYFIGATWQVHPTTLAVLCGQLDHEGRLLFPGLQNDTQTINGKRVYTNPWLGPLPAAGPNSPTVSTPTLVLGDFSKVTIRMAQPCFMRLEQTYAANLKVGFLAFTRVDSNIVAGGGTPIVYLDTTY
jgi:HK97 family phage major capsid protein